MYKNIKNLVSTPFQRTHSRISCVHNFQQYTIHEKMLNPAESVLFVLCFGGYLYSVYYCIEKYLDDHSVTNIG
jgi:hypothetical protein